MKSPSSALQSLRDLQVLQLKDLNIYTSYARKSTCPFNCWWTQFPYFWCYSLKGNRQSLWAVVDDLYVPFLFSGKYLSLLTIPFGEGDPDLYLNVLKKCFDFCARQNGREQSMTHARWITGDQVRFLAQSKEFSRFFAPKRLHLGPECHYSIQALRGLEGKEFEGIRRKRNKFLKNHPDISIRHYTASDYARAVALHESWTADAKNRYSDIFDRDYYPAFLKDHHAFDHIILVAEHDNAIVGLTAGSLTPDGQSYCYLRKALLEYEGLSEILVLRLAEAIHEKDERVQFLNDGGTGRKPGMTAFKTRFRPHKMVNRYRLQMNAPIVRQQTVYQGPNIAGLHPAARLVIESNHTDLFAELSAQELARLASLIADTFSSDGEKIQWEPEKTPALLLAQLAVLIQQASRHPVQHYTARPLSSTKTEISFEMLRPSLLQPLIRSLTAFWVSGFLGFAPHIFIDQYRADRKSFGFTLHEFIVWDRIRTARRLGIPARPDKGFRVWLGRGNERRLTSLGYTQNTPRLAKTIAGDKSISHSYLDKRGLPLPQQLVVRNEKAARRAARQIGYPVVLKPRQGNKGEGVSVNLTSTAAVTEAFNEAGTIDRAVVVESYVEGDDFRLLVINGRYIAAVKRIPAHVTGDGRHTVRKLMELTNRKERRDGLFLLPLRIDGAVLKLLDEQGLTPESIPTEGQYVMLRRAANVSLGGTIEDVTDHVHPDNRAAAISAAEACLLDVAGVDFKTTDISKSWRKGYGRIIEINSGPGVELHMEPTIGSPREVTHHLIRGHFPAHRKQQYPLIVISGRYGKEATARHCARLWSRMGIMPGVLLKDRLIAGTKTTPLAKPQFERMEILDRHTECDAAAIALSMETILKEGIGTDSCTCAVLTDDLVNESISAGYHDPQAPDRVFRLLADLATHGIVIDGSSARLWNAVEHLPAQNVVAAWPTPYTSLPRQCREHVERGGRAIGIRKTDDGPAMLTWYENGTATDVGPLPPIAADRTKSLMMACAASLVTSVSPGKLQSVLTGYGGSVSFRDAGLVTDRCPMSGVRVACAEPGDIEAMKMFAGQMTGGTLYLVASNKPGMHGEWQRWQKELNGNIILLLLEGKPGSSPGGDNAQTVGSLQEAWRMALHLARTNDIVLLLTSNYPGRQQFLGYWHSQAGQFSTPSPETLWPAETLAELFRGTWISGRSGGWGGNRIGWGKGMIGRDTVTILPGSYPELTADRVRMEQDLAAVLRSGAHAVISAVHSCSLPRWKKVMQTDDPYGGLLRLARHARQRLQGLVMTVTPGGNGAVGPVLELARRYLTAHTRHDIYVGSQQADEGPEDDVIAAALALVNAPPGYSLYVFPWMPVDLFTARLFSADLVLVDDTASRMKKPSSLVQRLSDDASIFVLTTPDQEVRWRGSAAASGHGLRLRTARQTDPAPGPDWEQLLALVRELPDMR